MKISMIAAMAKNRVIGTGSGIPWDLPRDAYHFRTYTAGKFMLLGRKTFEEMEGWFTTQIPIVLTGKSDYKVENGHVADSVESGRDIAKEQGAPELVVSGGASVYEAALPLADQLVLTFVEEEIPGEVQFPDYEAEADWETLSELRLEADDENPYAMTFVILERCAQ
ncbi:MAG: diacylglycerol kinase [Verrucomicrobiales bacterium]|nr:diacylglycerol kinase [Verrucomicrobiales bacterium]